MDMPRMVLCYMDDEMGKVVFSEK